MTSRTPNLAPWHTADLALHAIYWEDGDLPVHGDALEVVARLRFGDWLEGAVVAGHVPNGEGIILALQALHLLNADEIALLPQAGSALTLYTPLTAADTYDRIIL
jgi:hypothetical protein